MMQGMIFTAESITAILAGTKYQTRRLVTHGSIRPRWNKDAWAQLDLATAWVDPGPSPAGNPGPYLKAKRYDPTAPGSRSEEFTTVVRLYPRHFAGDLLYVKETWNFSGRRPPALQRSNGAEATARRSSCLSAEPSARGAVEHR